MTKEVKLVNMIKHNFIYEIEYDYDTDRNNCDCDDYCRCSTISSAHIVGDIDLTVVSNRFNKTVGADKFLSYAVNRVLTACELYNKDYWNVEVVDGYYGEEIGGVYIDSPQLLKWMEKLDNAKTDEEKLFVALECEYGYILDELKSKTWSIEITDKIFLSVGQKEHYTKLNKKAVDSYKNFCFPLGVCIVQGDKYRLIDGYHRTMANKNDVIEIIVGR